LTLTPEQEHHAQELATHLRLAFAEDIEFLARLLASKADHQLLGETEFQVRDVVHRLGATALETALEERKKGGTLAPAPPAPTAQRRPSSNAGRPKRS
jgi:hypothetical protein